MNVEALGHPNAVKTPAAKPAKPKEHDSLDVNTYPIVAELHAKIGKKKIAITELDIRIENLAAQIVALSTSPKDAAKASFAAKLKGKNVEPVPVYELKEERKALLTDRVRLEDELRIALEELNVAKEHFSNEIRDKVRPLFKACRVKELEYLVGLSHERQSQIALLNTLERGDVNMGDLIPSSNLSEMAPWNGYGLVCQTARELVQCGYLPETSPLLTGINWQCEENNEFELKVRAKTQRGGWIKKLLSGDE